jgi:ubiquitin-protein ligase
LKNNPITGVQLLSDVITDDNTREWLLNVSAPQESIYSGGIFRVLFKFGSNYPNEPPVV